MIMNNFKNVIVALLFTVGLGLHPVKSAETPAYNVLWLMTDEHSAHALGCYGNPVVKTPNLDALAKSGALCRAGYCQNPICVPSRSSFICSKMPSELGIFGNDATNVNFGTTIAQVYKKAGYQTVWLGKWHYAGESYFDKMDGEEVKISKARKEAHSGSRLPQEASVSSFPEDNEMEAVDKDFAIKFLQQNKDKKFFLGVSFPKPHFPYTIQKKYYDMYKDCVDMPHVTPEMIAGLPQLSQTERTRYKLNTMTDGQTKVAKAIYYGMITYVDGLFGDILAELDRLHLRDKTIIIYIADHGEMMGEHGLWYKNTFYESGVRVPYIWSFPKVIQPGTIIDAPTMNLDIFPTLCDLCGLPQPAGLEGKSLVPLFTGKEKGDDRVAISENYRDGMSGKMIRYQNWKYCYFPKDREQLFDLSKDPEEVVNLVKKPEYQDIVKDLKERALKGWIQEEPEGKKKKGDKGD
jgi:choline-sulfatase